MLMPTSPDGLLLAALCTFVVGWLLFPLFIKFVALAIQPLRSEGPGSHLQAKAGTPTMGGVMIVLLLLCSSLYFVRYNAAVKVVMFVALSNAFIGFVDDLYKVCLHHNRGLSVRTKFSFQIIVSVMGAFLIGKMVHYRILLPFALEIHSVTCYILFATLVIVGTANAVNLTDGLDGLVIVPIIIALSCCVVLAVVADVSDYMQLALLSSCCIGSCFAFWWFNTFPAKIFMGDVGSLSLGSFVAAVILLLQKEILLPIIGLLFVLEALSVILQVWSYKTRGKRIFLMSPLHHHFEQKGMSEVTIVTRAWIFAAFSAALGMLCWFYIY